MAEHEGIEAGRHRIFVLNTHLVFATRYRHRVCTGAHLNRGEHIMRGVCAGFEVELRGSSTAKASTCTRW